MNSTTQPMNSAEMSKAISVRLAETGAITDLGIGPGTTAREILQHVNLDPQTYVLSQQGKEAFLNEDNVFAAVTNGEKLFANTPAEAGCGTIL